MHRSKRLVVTLAALFALAAITAAPALASGKPFVETTAASSVAETSATLNGVVNPNGAETKYYFEYGETIAYGSKTEEVSAGSGESNVKVSKALTGLTAATTYHFRIVATNSNGTSDGSDEVFATTGTAKPSVETKPASSETETGATLNGSVNPHGLETKYYFEYGETTSYGSKTAEGSAGSGKTSVAESKAITGLKAATTYHFRIVATNSKGTTDGGDRIFTSPPKPSVETKPATSIAKTTAYLNGVVDPRALETKYYFEYGTTESYGTKTAEASAGSGTKNVEVSKSITGLTEGTKYYFRIVAKNSAGTTYGANEAFSTTTLPEFVPSEGSFPITLEGSFPSQNGGITSGAEKLDLKCEGVYAKGEVTGVKTASLSIELRKCAWDGFSCSTAEEGVIVLSGNASLVYIDKATKEVGIVLTQKEIRYQCGEEKFYVRGGLVIPLTPINTKTSEPRLTITGNGKGVQTVSSYENEKGEVVKSHLELNGGSGFIPAALETGALSLKANKAFTVSA